MLFYFLVFILASTASHGCVYEQSTYRYPHTSLISWAEPDIHSWYDIWDDFNDNWPLLGCDQFSPGLLTYQRPICHHATQQGDEETHGQLRHSDGQSMSLEKQRLERIYRESLEKSKHLQAEMEEIKSKIERLRQPSSREDRQWHYGNNKQLHKEESRYRHENIPRDQGQGFNVDEPSPFQAHQANVQHEDEQYVHRTRQHREPDINQQRQNRKRDSNVDREHHHHRQDRPENSRLHQGLDGLQRHDQSVSTQNEHHEQNVKRQSKRERPQSNIHQQSQKQYDNHRRRTEPKVNDFHENQNVESDSLYQHSRGEQYVRDQHHRENRHDQGRRQRDEPEASFGRQKNTERSRNIPNSKGFGKMQDIMVIPMRGFQPGDLKISHHGDSIRVHASRTCKGKENCVSREMDISYPLPYRIEAGAMKASVDGSNIVIRGIPVRTERSEDPIGTEQESDDFDGFINEDKFHSSISPQGHVVSSPEIADDFQEYDSDVEVEVED